MKTFIISVLAFLASLGAVGFVVMQDAPGAPSLGAAAGPEVTEKTFFRDDVVVGGTSFATSSVGAGTYTATQITNSKIIVHTAASALTVTLPASSTLSSFIPKIGDTKTTFLLPVTTGITVAGGTGTDLNTSSSTKFCVVNQLCRLDFVRKPNSDIEVLLTSSSGN